MRVSPKSQRTLFVILWVSTCMGTISLLAPWGMTLRVWMFSAALLGLLKIIELGYFARLTNKSFVLACLLYFFALICSGINSLEATAWLSRLLSSFLLIGVSILISQIRDYDVLKKAISVIIISGTLFSVLAILEIYVSFANPSLYSLLHYFDVDGNPGEKQLGTIAGLPRARGYFVEPNEFSQFLLLPTGLIIAYSFLSFRHNDNFKREKLLSIALAILIIAQISALSRGGFLGVLLQLFALLVLKRLYGIAYDKKFLSELKKLFTFICILTLLVSYFFSSELGMVIDIIRYLGFRFSTSGTGDDPTFLLRFSATMQTLKIWTSDFGSFLTGVGLGNLQFTQLGGYTSSNLIADIACETGILGVIAFFFILLNLWIININQIKRYRANRVGTGIVLLSIGSALSAIGLLIGGLTYSTHNLLVLWVSFGLIAASNNVAMLSR